MSKIKSCTILNPPVDPKQQEQIVAKALALALYRSLGAEQVEQLIKELGGRQNVSS